MDLAGHIPTLVQEEGMYVGQPRLPGMDNYFGGMNPDVEALSRVELDAELSVLGVHMAAVQARQRELTAMADELTERRRDIALAIVRIDKSPLE